MITLCALFFFRRLTTRMPQILLSYLLQIQAEMLSLTQRPISIPLWSKGIMKDLAQHSCNQNI